MPKLELTKVRVPELHMREVQLPDMKLPEVTLADVKLPEFKVPEGTCAAVEISELREQTRARMDEAVKTVRGNVEHTITLIREAVNV